MSIKYDTSPLARWQWLNECCCVFEGWDIKEVHQQAVTAILAGRPRHMANTIVMRMTDAEYQSARERELAEIEKFVEREEQLMEQEG